MSDFFNNAPETSIPIELEAVYELLEKAETDEEIKKMIGEIVNNLLVRIGSLEGSGQLLALKYERSQDAENESLAVISKLSTLLAEIAITLKGEELALHRHGYHDLNDLVKTHKEDAARLDWLEENASFSCMFTTGELAFEMPDDYEGSDTIREAIDAAIIHSQAGDK